MYVYTRAYGGISTDQLIGATTQETMNTYTVPFPIEMISITITDDGVKNFSWTGMCEAVSTIAKNVKLLPFDDIQKQLFDQIFYKYSSHGQPAEDMTNFTYKVNFVKLGYTYVTAFQNPQDGWLVPTWFFEVMEGEGPEADVKDLLAFPVAINAMDGGAIVHSND